MTSSVDGAPRTRQARPVGPPARLDPRVNAVRPDLADAALAGHVAASRYVNGETMRSTSTAVLRSHPDPDAIAVSMVLPGEELVVFDRSNGWAWGQCRHDRYVGWTRFDGLVVPTTPASHRVGVGTAAVFAAPDIKSRIVAILPLNSLITGEAAGDFVAAAGGYLHRRHVRPVAEFAVDAVAVALGFVGSPYVWGGRTRDGIDCSGLTQAALMACGIACPRDSDQQHAVGDAVALADRRRGDLVFLPGHVGILANAETLVHANAYWMATVAEPLADVLARVAATAVRRPPTLA